MMKKVCGKVVQCSETDENGWQAKFNEAIKDIVVKIGEKYTPGLCMTFCAFITGLVTFTSIWIGIIVLFGLQQL
jgi:hypothetical protein